MLSGSRGPTKTMPCSLTHGAESCLTVAHGIRSLSGEAVTQALCGQHLALYRATGGREPLRARRNLLRRLTTTRRATVCVVARSSRHWRRGPIRCHGGYSDPDVCHLLVLHDAGAKFEDGSSNHRYIDRLFVRIAPCVRRDRNSSGPDRKLMCGFGLDLC